MATKSSSKSAGKLPRKRRKQNVTPANLLPEIAIMRLEVFAAAMWPQETVMPEADGFLHIRDCFDLNDGTVLHEYVDALDGDTKRIEIGELPQGLATFCLEGCDDMDATYVGAREAIAELAKASKAYMNAYLTICRLLRCDTLKVVEAKGGAV